MKVTKKLLKDYTKIKREIPMLEQELQEMLSTEAGLGSSTILDYSKGYPMPQAIVGFDYPLYEHKRTVLANKKAKAAAIEEWIDKIQDIETRMVFKMRYKESKSWKRIAEEIGRPGKEDYVRIKIRDEFLKKNKIF